MIALANDLLGDSRTTDVIITKFDPLCFKMVESFENLVNILRDWSEVRPKTIGTEQVREAGRRKKSFLLLENDLEKTPEYSQSVVERD